MNRAAIKQFAQERLQHFWGYSVLAMLLYTIILCVLGPTGIGVLVLSGVLAYGLCNFYLRVYRTGEAQLEDLFGGFQNFLNTFLTGLLTAVFTALWSLLFIIPGIVAALSYSMAQFILVDHPELSAMDAINESKRMMTGHKGELFVLYLSFLGWFILSGLTGGILYFLYVGPYCNMTLAGFYETLKNQNQ